MPEVRQVDLITFRKMYGIAEDTILRWIHTKEFPAYKQGRNIKIERDTENLITRLHPFGSEDMHIGNISADDKPTENPSEFFFSNNENYEIRWNSSHTEAALYLKSDPPVKFSVTINGLSETVTLNDVYDGTTIIIAFYKSNGELVDVKTYQPQATINAEPPKETDSYAYAKVLWWRNLDTLHPLCEPVKVE